MKKPRESVVFKSIAGIIIPLIILSLVAAILGYSSITSAMLELYEKGAVQIAQTAAEQIDADKLDEYEATGWTSAEYKEARSRMDRLCNTSEATFIYVIRPDLTDYRHITFHFATINRNSSYTVYNAGYSRETTNDDYRTKYRKLYEGASSFEIVIRDRGYIETDAHITAMVPLKGKDGQTKAIMCVQRQMENLTTVRNRFIRIVLQALTVLVILVILIQNFYMRHVLLRPLAKIRVEAARFAEQEKTTGEKLSDTVRNRDEIGKLAGSIDQMEERITSHIEELTSATAEKERISTELSLAKRIQADILPNEFPAFPERDEFDIYATMTPAKEVGGDFYDFFLIDPDHLALVIADVSGKGIPAALFMMASKIMIKNITLGGASPSEILETMNNRICHSKHEEMFVTVWLGILDLRTGLLTAANAGHEYPVVESSDGRFELVKDKHGFVVGGMEGIRYSGYELKLEPGQQLFLYTDGVPEATNAAGELYGMERLLKVLNVHTGMEPRKVLDAVKADVDLFVGESPQFDDLTMMSVKYNRRPCAQGE